MSNLSKFRANLPTGELQWNWVKYSDFLFIGLHLLRNLPTGQSVVDGFSRLLAETTRLKQNLF